MATLALLEKGQQTLQCEFEKKKQAFVVGRFSLYFLLCQTGRWSVQFLLNLAFRLCYSELKRFRREVSAEVVGSVSKKSFELNGRV